MRTDRMIPLAPFGEEPFEITIIRYNSLVACNLRGSRQLRVWIVNAKRGKIEKSMVTRRGNLFTIIACAFVSPCRGWKCDRCDKCSLDKVWQILANIREHRKKEILLPNCCTDAITISIFISFFLIISFSCKFLYRIYTIFFSQLNHIKHNSHVVPENSWTLTRF